MGKKTSKSHKNTQSTQPSRMIWFVIGAICSFMVADYASHIGYLPDFFQFLDHNSARSAQRQQAKTKQKVPQFDFYTMLQDNAETHAPPRAAKKPAPQQAKAKPKPPASQIYLQAAAVRNLSDADKLKASLILAGYDVHIKSFKKNQTTWYRILIGPYASKAAATSAKQKLKSAHVDAIFAPNPQVG